jgi:hypothetical protein
MAYLLQEGGPSLDLALEREVVPTDEMRRLVEEAGWEKNLMAGGIST